MKSLWEWLLLIVGFIYWAVAGLSVTLIANLLTLLLPPRYALMSGRFILQKVFQLFIAYLKITGLLILEDSDLKALARQQGAVIIAPNHLALWDAVFIIARIPEVVCIMKGAILRNPFLGGGAKLAGYIPNDSISKMLKLAALRLQTQEKLLMFPEGTRTKSAAQWLNPLKGGVALLAKRTKVPVVPVFIRSNTRFFEKGWPLYRKPVFPLKISITVGEPVIFGKHETAQTFSQRLEQIYMAELASPHPLRRQAIDTNGR